MALQIEPGTLAHQIYGRQTEISERHRHRYEFNREYEGTLTAAGLRISGSTPDGTYVEMIELPDHPHFIGCQFHPEFKSKPLEPHPCSKHLLGAAFEHGEKRRAEKGIAEVEMFHRPENVGKKIIFTAENAEPAEKFIKMFLCDPGELGVNLKSSQVDDILPNRQCSYWLRRSFPDCWALRD